MKVEIITTDADPNQGGFGARVFSLIQIFSQFAEVRVVLTEPFDGMRVPGVIYEMEPVKDTIGSKIRRLRTYYKTDFPKKDVRDMPDIVLIESLDRLGMHQHGGEVHLILDEHNVYWNLLEYEIVNNPFFRSWLGRRRWLRWLLIPRLLKRAKSFEVNALRRASLVLVTSETDRSAFLEELPELEERIHVLPNCVDLDRIPYSEDTPETNDVLFVGSFNYVPNQEAASYVFDTLAPALPQSRFLLVGSDPPPVPARVKNVVTTGYVEDLGPVLHGAAVCIAPLEHGSGTRLKILTYLAAGKAVVATAKACEGLDVQDGVHLLIADDPENFRMAISQAIADPDLRRRLGAAGRALVKAKYDWHAHVEEIREFTSRIWDNPGLQGAAQSLSSRPPYALEGTLPSPPHCILERLFHDAEDEAVALPVHQGHGTGAGNRVSAIGIRGVKLRLVDRHGHLPKLRRSELQDSVYDDPSTVATRRVLSRSEQAPIVHVWCPRGAAGAHVYLDGVAFMRLPWPE